MKKINKRSLRHGHAKTGKMTRVYAVWRSMKARCSNPNLKAYKHYGARGITVCKRWLIFENFLEDMGEPREGKSIHRVDNDKGYFKSNCVWATNAEQKENMSSTVVVKYKNKKTPLYKLVDKHGKRNRSQSLVLYKSGFTLDEILFSEKHNLMKHKLKDRIINDIFKLRCKHFLSVLEISKKLNISSSTADRILHGKSHRLGLASNLREKYKKILPGIRHKLVSENMTRRNLQNNPRSKN